MKNNFVLLLIIITTILLLNSCNDKGTNPKSSIQLLSYKTNGCLNQPKHILMKIKNYGTAIESVSENNQLKVNLNFSANCIAIHKDSVSTQENVITIFLKNINHEGAKCVCPYSEEFLFSVMDKNNITVKFFYWAYASDDYHEMADTTITIY